MDCKTLLSLEIHAKEDQYFVMFLVFWYEYVQVKMKVP